MFCIYIYSPKNERQSVVQLNSNGIMNKITPAKQDRNDFAGIRAFKNIHSQPNFTGLPKVSEAVKSFGEDFGKSAGEHFKSIIEKAKKHGLQVNNDEIVFPKEKLSHKAWEILTYPITGMPFDFANAILGGLKKISWFKNGLSDLSAKPFFQKLQKRKEAVESKSNIAAIQHYFELLSEGNNDYKRLVESHKRLAPFASAYNSETERCMTRIVTGMIPAFFLANDAYNLSVYMNNNKDLAREEKKRRFRQETLRIGATAGLTFGILSIFAKISNKNMYVAAGLTLIPVLISEVLGRLFAGNPVLPVSAKDAKEYAKKQGKVNQENKKDKNSTVQTTKRKSVLTLNNILKVLGGLVAFGFAVEKFSNISKVKGYLKTLGEKYKKLYMKDFIIEREKFDILLDKLHDSGFKKIADYYEYVVKNQTGKKIKLGLVEDKVKYTIINQILAFPFKFTWDVLMLPYKKVVKPLVNMLKGKTKKEELAKPEKIIQNSIQFLQKVEKLSGADFKKKVNQTLISSLDNLTKSSYENSELSTIVKTSSSVITSGFLIADNYNMVMIDSQGDNKNLAEQKAKERTIQRAARITYGTFIVKMMNDIFKGLYNSSLLGAQAVNVCNVLLTETLERKSVGLPLGESTQNEIKENEKIHMSATGIKGSYYRAMAKITGKKSFTNNKNS